MSGSDEPHPYPERSSSRMSTSGHASYKGRSCIMSIIKAIYVFTSSCLVDGSAQQCFGKMCCLHHQGTFNPSDGVVGTYLPHNATCRAKRTLFRKSGLEKRRGILVSMQVIRHMANWRCRSINS